MGKTVLKTQVLNTCIPRRTVLLSCDEGMACVAVERIVWESGNNSKEAELALMKNSCCWKAY